MKIFLFAFVIIVIFFIFISVILTYRQQPGPQILTTTPTPIPVSIYHNATPTPSPILPDPNVIYDSYPNSSSLSPQELAFPTGIPQGFIRTGKKGTLVITSDLESVTIFIDEAFTAEGSGPSSPANITPFTISLPSGIYEITAKKEGYVDAGFSVVIQEGEVSRLQVHLDPLIINP